MQTETAFKRTTYWAFCPDGLTLNPAQKEFILTEQDWPEKFHHWARVTRVKTGETLSLIQNETRTVCEISEISKKHIVCRVISQKILESPKPVITAAVCLIQHDRWEWMLEKLTELGVQKVIAVQSQYTQSKHIPKDWDKTRTRWERIILSAAEQSEQPVLAQLHPEIVNIKKLKLDNLYLANKRLEHEKRASWPSISADNVSFLIGPAGGWSPEELAWFETQHFQPISLGARILRTETAAMAMTILLNDRYENA